MSDESGNIESPEEFTKIESIYVRHRNALMVRGQFTPIYTDYYLHLMQHGIRHNGDLDLAHYHLDAVPDGLRSYGLELVDGGRELVYTYDTRGERTGITTLMNDLSQAGIRFNDLNTTQSSLEEIFVSLDKR